MAQTLPFYLVCDASGSMKGEPLRAINAALPDIHAEIGSNPVVADKTQFCIIGFGGTAGVVLPLSDLSAVVTMPTLGYRTGGTSYGAAFDLLYNTITDDIRKLKSNGDQVFRPAVFLLSDGRPNDKGWQASYQRVVDTSWPLRPNILAFGFGKADPGILQQVATVRAFIADKGMGPTAALKEFARSLIQSIVNSGSKASADGGLVLSVPDNVPASPRYRPIESDAGLDRPRDVRVCGTVMVILGVPIVKW